VISAVVYGVPCSAYVLNITDVSCNNRLLFIILQQNIVAIKVENDVLEENSIDMETDEVYASSACSLNKAEPEVSFVLR
jgi:hypothetical protein